jgi:phage baseplate assembly protein gpV
LPSTHHCTNVSKQEGAGSIRTYNIATDTFTPAKEHGGGGFVTFTDGSTFSYDVFANRTLPEGTIAAGPGETASATVLGQTTRWVAWD